MSPAPNIEGQRFGRLVAVRPSGKTKHRLSIWECICDCGGTARSTIGNLRGGQSRSCGCWRSEAVKAPRSHGDARRGGTKEYIAYRNMIARCGNPLNASYPNYGGRGVSVCERWLSGYSEFLSDVGRAPSSEHSIDRINPHGDYRPDNVRWVTMIDQQRNRRHHVRVTWEGRDRILGELCSEHGLHRHTVMDRLHRGWTLERALSTPADTRRGRRRCGSESA